MLVVVPVRKRDRELLVVRVLLYGRVDEHGRPQAVDVLALYNIVVGGIGARIE